MRWQSVLSGSAVCVRAHWAILTQWFAPMWCQWSLCMHQNHSWYIVHTLTSIGMYICKIGTEVRAEHYFCASFSVFSRIRGIHGVQIFFECNLWKQGGCQSWNSLHQNKQRNGAAAISLVSESCGVYCTLLSSAPICEDKVGLAAGLLSTLHVDGILSIQLPVLVHMVLLCVQEKILV